MRNATLVEKHKIFFRDLIVLARETMFITEKKIDTNLVYELFKQGNEDEWYQFTYDVKMKKWLVISHETNNQTVIFNPKVISGIGVFIDEFNKEDLLLAHLTVKEAYKNYKK